jgi:hypothetical protein
MCWPPAAVGDGRSTTMTDAQIGTLVLKDATGNYFLVAQATVEQGRVPEEHRAEVERLVAEASTSRAGEGDDTQGYFALDFEEGLTPLGYHLLMIANLEQLQWDLGRRIR